MAQPTAYTRQYNFTDYQSSSPADPLPADQVDAELNAVNLTLSEMRTNLGLLQRDDTKLANAAVHAESLSTAVLALIKATANGYGVQGAWAASTAYAIGDLVDFTQATYLCHEAHTSGSTFAANSSKFILLANAAIQSSASSVDVLSGDGATTAFTLSSNAPSGVTDVLVFVNGSLRTPTTHYTVSGTTITFVTAPSSGTDNVIVWGTSTVVEAAKTAAQAARDTAEAHRDDASEHKTTAERWANLEDATVVDADTSVDSGEYSAKEYAVGDTVTTGSAKDWASKAYNSPVVTSPSNEYSAKHYAQNIQEWATKDDGAVSGTDYSAKAHASVEGTNAPPEGSAKEWATAAEDTVVAGSEYSAKHYAAKAATDYASFTGVYKTGATDPYSSKDSGDLWYDTSASTLKVWSGSAWNELDTLPQNLGATDTPTFATPTASGHAAIKSYVDANAGDSLPSQTGKSGKFLTTDGSNTSWDDVPVDELFSNIALLGFKVAAQHSLAKYNLVDQTIDEFVDATGVDTTASTNETLTSGYYKVSPGTAGTVRKTYTGSDISYSVPSNVSTMTVELWGAGGGCGTGTTGSGGGGYAKGDLAVTAGETLTLIIGQGGRTAGVYSGSGGGGTFIYRGSTGTHSNILAAAGGGGGAIGGAHGGGGGGTTGGDSVNSNGTPSTGGSQSGVGAVGSTGSTGSSGGSVTQTNASGTNGGSITCASGTNTTTAYGGGGAGTSDNANWSAAGGGGGYYGGGSGGPLNSISAGAGGSGYVGGLTGTTTLTRGEESSSTNASGGSSSANHSTGIGSGGDNGAGGNGEMYFTYNEDSPAMTLVSQATTAQATPTSADIVMLYSNGAGTATLNTDLTAEVSRDGGTTWTSATLASQGTTGGHTIVTAHGVDISSQPSGTSMKWRVKTLNQSGSRETRIQAVSMGWA